MLKTINHLDKLNVDFPLKNEHVKLNKFWNFATIELQSQINRLYNIFYDLSR